MVDIYAISILVFIAILAAVVYKDRKNIEFKNYVLMMRRTKRFMNILNSIAKASPTFWKIVGTIGVIVAVYYMFFGVYNLLLVTNKIYLGEFKQPALQFVLPIPSSSTVSIPGVLGIPFWFWIITIAFVLIPHEFFHGILARAENIKLKSVGLLLLLIIPGAFVEPDEKQIKKSKLITKLRIFAGGSFINIVIAFTVGLLAQNLLWNNYVSPGVMILDINQTSPAASAGLKPGMVIESIDNQTLSLSFFDYSPTVITFPNSTSTDMPKLLSSAVLFSILSNHKPGDQIAVKADGRTFQLTLGTHPLNKDFPYIGLISHQINTSNPTLFVFILPLLAFISVLSFAVAIVNILPLYPLDGGLIFKAIVEQLNAKRANQIANTVSFFILFLILYGFIGPYLRFG